MLGIRTVMPLPGLSRWIRPTSSSELRVGKPSRIRHTLVVVPPMSKATTRSSSPVLAPCPAASAPAAGPDSSSRMGVRNEASTEASPPSDHIR